MTRAVSAMGKQSPVLSLAFFLLLTLGNAVILIYHVSDLWNGKDSTDFSTFYTSGTLVIHPHSLYAPDTGQSPVEGKGPVRPNSHLPYEALVFLPFSRLPYKAASLFWILFGIGLFLLSSKYLEEEFPYLRKSLGFAYDLIVFGFFPTLMVFLWGQDSAVLFLLMVLAYRQFVRSHNVSCGVLLALGMFKFQYVLPVVAILILRRKWKVIYGFVPAAALALLLSWIMIGNRGSAEYWRILTTAQGEWAWRMPNIRGAVETLGGSPLIIVVLSVIIVLWLGLAPVEDRGAQFSIAIICAELVSVHGHIYDMVLALIPILYLWNRLIRDGKPHLWLLGLFLSPLYVILAAYQMWYVLCVPVFVIGLSLIFTASIEEKHKYSAATQTG